MSNVRIALLSNPRSTGNRSLLPRVRSFCAEHPEIFHYEVESVEQIGPALKTIARVAPKVLVINGGDGTVQTTLTELYHGAHFAGERPPVAVLPNGKTNLIALDLGATGDPIEALERVLEIAYEDVEPHVVRREMIALTEVDDAKPVLGMFLGGAGLADSMLFCRNKVYPLGLPNGVAHALTMLALVASLVFGMRAAFLPPRPAPVTVSLLRQGQIQGRFSLLIVTTLQKMLLNTKTEGQQGLKLIAVDLSPVALVLGVLTAVLGRLGRQRVAGVHLGHGDEIRIEGERSAVILDGETFEAPKGGAITLRQTAPLPFLRLAA